MSAGALWISTSLIVLLSSSVQVMTGFGFAVLAMPMLVVLLDPHEAVATSMVLSTALVLMMWWRTHNEPRLPVGGKLYFAALLGLIPGCLALAFADLNTVRLAVGGITLAIVVHLTLSIWRTDIRQSRGAGIRIGQTRTLLTGFASGFLTGSLSMPGPPVVALLSSYLMPKSAYRATLNTFFAMIYPTGLLLMLATDLLSVRFLMESLLHVPALLLGMWIGNALHDAASEQVFALSLLAALAGAATACIWTGFGALWPH